MHVPLGPVVSVRHPWELARQAEEIFRSQDPKYEMRDYPVQLRVGDVTRIIHVGRSTIGVYEILVRHGFISGMPGTDECVSIERLGICPSTAAHNSAQLMEEETDDTRLER
jgi:hypothetical protein